MGSPGSSPRSVWREKLSFSGERARLSTRESSQEYGAREMGWCKVQLSSSESLRSGADESVREMKS